MRVAHREAFHSREVRHETAGQRSIIHVRAGDDPCGRHLLVGGASFHHERHPLGELALVLGEFHAVVAVMGAHRRIALLEERHVLGTVHEAHVRDRMDEALRVGDCARLHQIGPELAREVELDVHIQCLGNVDRSVGALGRIVELAVGRMAGAGVIPGVRALERGAAQRLEHLDIERGFKLLQQHAEGCAHDAGTDEGDVRFRGGLNCSHLFTWLAEGQFGTRPA